MSNPRSRTAEPERAIYLVLLDLLRPNSGRGLGAGQSEQGGGSRLSTLMVGGGRSSGWGSIFWPLSFLTVVLALFLYSLEPVVKLRSNPPPQLALVTVRRSIDQAAWAAAYWNRMKVLQSRFTRGIPLPESPPSEFRISQEAGFEKPAAEQIRLAYWKQIQAAWLTQDAWQRTYQVKREWVTTADKAWQDLQSDIARARRAGVR